MRGASNSRSAELIIILFHILRLSSCWLAWEPLACRVSSHLIVIRIIRSACAPCAVQLLPLNILDVKLLGQVPKRIWIFSAKVQRVDHLQQIIFTAPFFELFGGIWRIATLMIVLLLLLQDLQVEVFVCRDHVWLLFACQIIVLLEATDSCFVHITGLLFARVWYCGNAWVSAL